MAVQTREERYMVASGGGKEGLGATLSQMGDLGDPAWPVGAQALVVALCSAETLPD